MDHIRSSEPSARLASVHLLAAAFLPTFLSGCLIVPLPNRDTGNARKDLGQRVANRIEPGVTTMEHVMLELGEPDAVFSNERSIAYRRERAVAIWIAGGGYSAGGGTIDEVRFLL